ncbi:hypothetical protein ILYODFUR_038588 [Ilyodon furcidens]|uniref:Uncharacterized protein n=1 Tax=Ilyodon furcidens TaxID=33524 RepID=A0ABV0VBE3_9TELE
MRVGVGVGNCDCVCLFFFCDRLGLGLLLLLDQLMPSHIMGGLFPPRHTTCRWFESLPAGVLGVLGVWGRVLWCVLAHSWWLLAGTWPPGLCQASAWGGGVSRGLGSLGPWLDLLGRGRLLAGPVGSSLRLPRCWVVPLGLSTALLWGGGGSPGGGSSGVPELWGPLDVCGSDLLSVRPGTMGQVCGSSHSLLHIFVEKPCIQKRVHTYTHRC